MNVLKLILSKGIDISVYWMDGSPPLDKCVLFYHLLLVFNVQLQTFKPARLMPQRKLNQPCNQEYSMCNFVLLLAYSRPGIKII